VFAADDYQFIGYSLAVPFVLQFVNGPSEYSNCSI